MTTPFKRTRALLLTKIFLQRLSCLADALPPSLVVEAEVLLKSYPSLQDIEAAHRGAPDVFDPVPPFSQLGANPETQNTIDATKPQP